LFPQTAVARFPAVNPAERQWRAGFLGALRKHGASLRILGHRPERGWPKGRLFPNERWVLDEVFPTEFVRWMNFPGLRYPLLERLYVRSFQKLCRESGPPSAMVCYNPLPWHLAVARECAGSGIPWICVTLDYEDVGLNWMNYLRDTESAAGHVFLSHWGYSTFPGLASRLHMDAGVERWLGDDSSELAKPEGKRVVLYSGKFADYGGIELLVDSLSRVNTTDVEFWLTGKVVYPELFRYLRRDPRIRYLGFISDEELHQRSLVADVFLNPRPSDWVENRMAFPSKIVKYLAYGKPIVSTWTLGLAPDYHELLIIPEEETSIGMAKEIDKALSMSLADRQGVKARARQFIEGSRLWSTQAERFANWLSALA
jgi:glycosyltransferase involved in cell wall biosynthesis